MAGEIASFDIESRLLERSGTRNMALVVFALTQLAKESDVSLVGSELFRGAGARITNNRWNAMREVIRLLLKKEYQLIDQARFESLVSGPIKRPAILDLDLVVSDLGNALSILNQSSGKDGVSWSRQTSGTGLEIIRANLGAGIDIVLSKEDDPRSYRNVAFSTNYDAARGRVYSDNGRLKCSLTKKRFWERLEDPGHIWFRNIGLLQKRSLDVQQMVVARMARILITYSWPDGPFGGKICLSAGGGGNPAQYFWEVIGKVVDSFTDDSLPSVKYAQSQIASLVSGKLVVPVDIYHRQGIVPSCA